MKLFRGLYDRVIGWSKHRHATVYLGVISFIESIFFPIPTALMFAPMAIAQRHRVWWLALYTTILSVLGGIVGYAIGALLFDEVGLRIIDFYHASDKYAMVQQWFEQYGVWLVLLAGFSPIPYKIITLASGAVMLSFPGFVIASLVGRASQFFLIAIIAYFGGPFIEQKLYRWMEWIGWSVIVIAGLVYLLWR